MHKAVLKPSDQLRIDPESRAHRAKNNAGDTRASQRRAKTYKQRVKQSR